MMEDVAKAISEKKHVIAHAPTGLGKSAAAIAPALSYALEHGKNVIFLTPKHTQHFIVIETLAKIRDKFNINVNAVDFIGKKWMCLVPGVQTLTSKDFSEFCREAKLEERCPFYKNVRKKTELTAEARKMIKDLQKKSPMHVEELCSECGKHEMCSYEMSCELAKESNFLIADYYHIFHPSIRKAFLMKTGKEFKDSIIIVDEAQNLPERIRSVLSSKISNFSIKKAIYEARKFKFEEIANALTGLNEVLADMAKLIEEKNERYVTKEEFIKTVESRTGFKYDQLTADMIFAGDKIRQENKKSYVGSMGSFLDSWNVDDDGYARILKTGIWKEKQFFELNLRCIDPAVSSKELFDECHSAILMSGTLAPTQMYRDLLDMEKSRTICAEYESPFPSDNRLALIVPDTTTKYTRRKDEEFEKIAQWCADAVNAIPGNVAVFFPSYRVRDDVNRYFERKSHKSIFLEQPTMTKREKMEFLKTFKEYADLGAVFLGATAGNFGEGIDLPGKFLKGVIVVGIPFDTPDLETNALIDYYDKKFGSGWNYGYLYPAMNHVIQACGRVIRSEQDYGVVVLIDERFIWKNYFRCLPLNWKITVTLTPVERIKKFFEDKKLK
jgi:DNA excision repair protein ERCC-2